MFHGPVSSLLLLPFLLLFSSPAAALPSTSSDPSSSSLSLRDTNTTTTNTTCPYATTWYIGSFHTYQAQAPNSRPYQAFYFTIYDSTGSLARASCSRIGSPTQNVEDLLLSYSSSTWHPCHVYNGAITNIDTSPDSRSNYQFQWDEAKTTLFVRGRGKCGGQEVRSERLEPVKQGVPWVYSSFSTGDLGEDRVNQKGNYRLYGGGGEVRLRHDGLGNPVKSFD